MPDAIEKELIDIAADLLRGPNPSIPYEDSTDADRAEFAFECAKEMLIECINERELEEMTGIRIATSADRTSKIGVRNSPIIIV